MQACFLSLSIAFGDCLSLDSRYVKITVHFCDDAMYFIISVMLIDDND